jgi:hypothetical protein
MTTRYYWTDKMNHIRWKTTDMDGRIAEWRDSNVPPIPSFNENRWSGDPRNVRPAGAVFPPIDEYGDNVWFNTIEENPYYKTFQYNQKMNDSKSMNINNKLNYLNNIDEIQYLKNRIIKLEDMLGTMVVNNARLLEMVPQRVNDDIPPTHLNNDWWEEYKNAAENLMDDKRRFINSLNDDWYNTHVTNPIAQDEASGKAIRPYTIYEKYQRGCSFLELLGEYPALTPNILLNILQLYEPENFK